MIVVYDFIIVYICISQIHTNTFYLIKLRNLIAYSLGGTHEMFESTNVCFNEYSICFCILLDEQN